MSSAVAIIAALGVLLTIGWLQGQPAAARRQAINRLLLVAGILILLLALFSGRIHPLIAAAGIAAILLKQLFAAKLSAGQPSGGRRSEISTRYLDMSLDHDSGDMDGTVREGRFVGRSLSQLSIDELLDLLAQCRAEDEQSATVLEAYLDRMHGDGWRERMGSDANHEQRTTHTGAAMSEEEARAILDVSESAGHDEIVAAHRKLMQKLHPDRGGSTYLAAKVNQAKELLLKGQ